MMAKTGSVVTWHWAHRVYNPDCTIAPESEWHLAWKALGLDGSQEVMAGNRRAGVLAPGGFAVEFQASALSGEEVRAREDDWAAQGGMAWVFKADQARIEAGEFPPPEWKPLLREENLATLKITWPYAPERVRMARAPSFLDIGDDQLLFAGGWRADSSPMAGYGWRVAENWVVENLLHGDGIPGPLAEDPEEVNRKIEAWQQQKRPGISGWLAGDLLRRLEDLVKTGQSGRPGSVRAMWGVLSGAQDSHGERL